MADQMNQHKMMAMGKGLMGKGDIGYAAGGQVSPKIGKKEPNKAPSASGKSAKAASGNKTNAIPTFKGGGKVGKK